MSKKNICLDLCNALCCRYFAMDIKKPRTKWDIDDLKWRLQYEAIKVYIVNNRWSLLIESKCRYLKKNNNCSIYASRPETCREHSHLNCEKDNEWYDILLTCPEDLEAYFKKEKAKKVKKEKIKQK